MQLKRFLSISAALTFSAVGLVAGVFLGWLPALILSLLGIGPFVFVASGAAGLIGGFAAYVKLCEHYQFWPLEKPAVSWMGAAGAFISKPEEKTLYKDLKIAVQSIEAELRQTYSAGWENFNIELGDSSPKVIVPQLAALVNSGVPENPELEQTSWLSSWFKAKKS